MNGTRQEYIEKLRPHVEEIYDLHIKSLDIKRLELKKKMEELEVRMASAKTRKENMVYNIGRGTDQDLQSYHFLFFAIEGTVKS